MITVIKSLNYGSVGFSLHALNDIRVIAKLGGCVAIGASFYKVRSNISSMQTALYSRLYYYIYIPLYIYIYIYIYIYNIYVIVISHYEWDIIVITRCRGEAEAECNTDNDIPRV